MRGFFRRLGLAGTQDIGEALKVGVPGVEYGDPGVDVDQVTRFDESGQIAPAPPVKTGRDARIASPGVIQAETFDAIAYRLVQLAVVVWPGTTVKNASRSIRSVISAAFRMMASSAGIFTPSHRMTSSCDDLSRLARVAPSAARSSAS